MNILSYHSRQFTCRPQNSPRGRELNCWANIDAVICVFNGSKCFPLKSYFPLKSFAAYFPSASICLRHISLWLARAQTYYDPLHEKYYYSFVEKN